MYIHKHVCTYINIYVHAQSLIDSSVRPWICFLVQLHRERERKKERQREREREREKERQRERETEKKREREAERKR